MSSPTTLLILLTLIIHALGVVVNRTIDDQAGDSVTGAVPIYTPADQWSQGASCPGCYAQPDKDKAFGGTWHDSTYHPEDGTPFSVTLSFNGSAIYAFFITIPALEFANSETHLNITLDGQPSGVFDFVPGPTDTYSYNHLVYSNSSLPSGPHILVLSAGINQTSVLEFDYAVYSVEDGKQPSSSSSMPSSSLPGQSSPSPSSRPSPKSSHTVSTGAIVGAVIGVIAILAAVTVALFYCCRRDRKGKPTVILETDGDYENTVFLGEANHWQGRALNGHDTTFGSGVVSVTSNELSSGNQEQRNLPYGYATPFILPSEADSSTSSNIPPKSKAALRQSELRRRLQAIELEMADLERRSTSQALPSTSSSNDPRETVELLREEIARLRAAQHSQWAQGLSDEPPPIYTEAPGPR